MKYPKTGSQDYDFILDPDPQTITVQYLDQDEKGEDGKPKVLATKTLHGYSDMTANYSVGDNITKYSEKGYAPISDSTNGKPLVFDENDNKDQAQVYTIVLGNKHDQKTETKTVTRTVHIISPDKTTTQTKNQITFTRTADVDEVTGQTQHSGWTNGDNGTFNEVIIHAVAGYTPQSDITEDLEKNSKGQYEIKSFHVDQDSNDIVVNVTYGADA